MKTLNLSPKIHEHSPKIPDKLQKIPHTPQKIPDKPQKIPDLPSKTLVTKSKSTSILIKEKISLAFGKTAQSKQKIPTKPTHTSYLTKQRSLSQKSFNRTKNEPLKNTSQLIQKLSFYDQTPSKVKNPNLSRSRNQKTQRQKSSFSSSQNQSFNDRESSFQHQKKYEELMWIDSKKRKFKIVNKNILLLGMETGTQRCVEYCIGADENEEFLVKIEGENATLFNNDLSTFWGKYDQKSKKIECVSKGKVEIKLRLNFEGLILMVQKCSNQRSQNEKRSSSKELSQNLQGGLENEICSFLIEQMCKLREDGVKEFGVIQKIVRRILEQRFGQRLKEVSVFVMKVEGRPERKQRERVLETDKLISQKLGYMESGEKNMGSIFNRKKFIG